MIGAARDQASYRIAQIIRDWLATGRINAIADAEVMTSNEDVPGEFVLMVEDNQLGRGHFGAAECGKFAGATRLSRK